LKTNFTIVYKRDDAFIQRKCNMHNLQRDQRAPSKASFNVSLARVLSAQFFGNKDTYCVVDGTG
jgi:hypothetical protein